MFSPTRLHHYPLANSRFSFRTGSQGQGHVPKHRMHGRSTYRCRPRETGDERTRRQGIDSDPAGSTCVPSSQEGWTCEAIDCRTWRGVGRFIHVCTFICIAQCTASRARDYRIIPRLSCGFVMCARLGRILQSRTLFGPLTWPPLSAAASPPSSPYIV